MPKKGELYLEQPEEARFITRKKERRKKERNKEECADKSGTLHRGFVCRSFCVTY